MNEGRGRSSTPDTDQTRVLTELKYVIDSGRIKSQCSKNSAKNSNAVPHSVKIMQNFRQLFATCTEDEPLCVDNATASPLLKSKGF